MLDPRALHPEQPTTDAAALGSLGPTADPDRRQRSHRCRMRWRHYMQLAMTHNATYSSFLRSAAPGHARVGVSRFGGWFVAGYTYSIWLAAA